MSKKTEETNTKSKSDGPNPFLVLAVSLFGFFFTVPTLGYFMLGKMKKGLVYQFVYWLLLAGAIFIWLIGGLITAFVGFICLLPMFIPNVIMALALFVDTFYVAKGEKPKLPEF